jgi:adenylate cyclase
MIEPTPGGEPAASSQRATRLLAVLAADVVDYTRLTEAAELETHARLRALRVGIIDPCVVSYRGQIIKNTGDGFLATFDSSVDALRCAVEIQARFFSARPPHLGISGYSCGSVSTSDK